MPSARTPTAASQPEAAPSHADAAIPIIDTHQHLWDLTKLRVPWVPAEGPLAGSHTMGDYLRAAEGLGVAKTVYMEVDVDPADHVAEAEYVLDLCRRREGPIVAAVIGGRPASPGFGAYVKRYKGSRYVKGVRQVLHGAGTPRGYCLTDDYVRGVRLLGEAGLVFDVCLPAAFLPDACKLADACRETRLVLDHCGNANVQAKDLTDWRRDIADVARRPNVVCKISGIVATARPGAWTAEDLAPIVLHCAEVFGRDRIMFASDWPVCTVAATYRQWVAALREVVRAWPAGDRRKLFHDNAARFYGIV
jgi:L-fuconolactonase